MVEADVPRGSSKIMIDVRSRSLVLWLFPTLGRDTGIAGRVDLYEWVGDGEAATTSFGRSGHTRQGSVSGGCGCRDDCGVLGRRVAGRLEVGGCQSLVEKVCVQGIELSLLAAGVSLA